MIEHLLADVQAGRSGVLVMRGEAGIGKTAILEHARHAASRAGIRVETSVGVESETQFAFAGLHQLCAPLLKHASELPDPQEAALAVAFGQRSGPAPEGFLVGLSILNLLVEAAQDKPLLCLVDDAQWLDEASAQVLAFVARRVSAEPVALVFALRDPGAVDDPFAGLPELCLAGLDESDAQKLLAGAIGTPLDDGVRDRIVAEARGNPLALLELPRGAPAAQLAGGFAMPDLLSVPGRIEASFERRSASLPAETRLLLLVAAAEPTGETALLWRAATHLGIAREAVAPAEASELLEVGARVRFCHPLVRSAVYQAATPPDRRRAHGALAVATDPQADPDRRAWHRAQSVLGTDEEVAADLERSAGRARARGGLAAAAAFLQHAAELTPDPAARATRTLEAAHAKHDAGSSEAALELLSSAATGPLDALQRSRLELLRAQIAFHLTRGGDVPRMLLDAAKTLAPLDASLSRETYLHALDAAIITGGLDHGGGRVEAAEASRSAPPPPGRPGPADLLLDGLVTTYTQGYAAGVPQLRRALEAFCADDGPTETACGGDARRWHWLASRTALTIFDDDLLHALAHRNVRLAREAGALATLPASLLFLAAVSVLSGEPEKATALIAEETAITQATGGPSLRFGQLLLAAWRGQQDVTVEVHAAAVKEAAGRGNGAEVSVAQVAMAVLHNGLGNYALALDAAMRACESLEPPHINLALPELIEAATRAGEPAHAGAALDQLTSRARASGTSWALGMEAHSRALTSTGSVAEEQHRRAIALLHDCRMGAYRARSHLVYGEWLRREGRRQDAREQLRTAHQQLSHMGMEAFAERAARELRATGEHPRKRTAQPTDSLTAQELHIARLVATGATTREVAGQLFVSPRTVEAHLRNIFRKLGITSRRQLRELSLA